MKKIYIILFVFVTLGFASCVTNDNSPGLEYMPDMYRSPAIEAYVDYGFDEYKPGMTAAKADSMRLVKSVKLPPEGTIKYAKPEKMVFNMPYPYPNTEAGYESAGTNWKSPIPLTAENMAEGKQLFETFCIQCHGEKGAGDGSITKNGKYPPVPTYASRKGLPEGKMFHTITYGKGLMGSHAYILNQEERWLVIQHVKLLMGDVEPLGEESEESEESEENAMVDENNHSEEEHDAGEHSEGMNDEHSGEHGEEGKGLTPEGTH